MTKRVSLAVGLGAGVALGLLLDANLPLRLRPISPDAEPQPAAGVEGSTQTPVSSGAAAPTASAKFSPGSLETDLQRALATPSGTMREQLLSRIRDSISSADVPRALTFLATRQAGFQSSLFRELACRWASADPRAALKWANSLVSPPARTCATECIAETWSAVDAKGAASFALGQATGKGRDTLLRAVTKELAAADPVAAMAWSASLPLGQLRNRVLADVLEQYAQDDPRGAARSLLTMPPGAEQKHACAVIAASWAGQDPDSTSSWIATLPQSLQETAATGMVSALMKLDKPEIAAALVPSLPPGQLQQRLFGDVARDWASQDLSGALAWLKQLPDGRGKEIVFQSLSAEWADIDPGAALEYARTLPAGKSARDLSSSIVRTWVANDPAAVLNWATNLPDFAAQKEALVNQVMYHWAQVSPEAAASFAATLQPGPLQDDSVMKVVREWSFRDARSASEWVGQFPPCELRDKAVDSIVFWGQGQDPGATVAMLDKIGSPDLLQKHGEQLASIWLSRDPADARAWIEHSSLTDEVKQRLLNGGSR